jgi:hypothetical protein
LVVFVLTRRRRRSRSSAPSSLVTRPNQTAPLPG